MNRALLTAAKVALTAALVWFVGREIVTQWNDARAAGFELNVRWEYVAASGALVLLGYAILIQAWRVMVNGWGSRLGYRDAARIWFVSNLGRYVPGKVWQITAMAVMAEQAGVSRYAAAGSAVLVNLVNLVAGVGVITVTTASVLENRSLILGSTAVLGLLLLLTPRLVPWLVALYARVRRKERQVAAVGSGPIWMTAILSVAAWVLYGGAFMLLAKGVVASSTGSVASYIGAFTTSYLAGYLFLLAPGGIGAREGVLLVLLDRLQLATGGAGAVIVTASRLWLTVLEVLPGAVYLAMGAAPPRLRNPIAHERTD